MPRREKSYPACGRLVVLESRGSSAQPDNLIDRLDANTGLLGYTSINFPAMPDGIDLARRAEYAVSTPIGFPDGIHMYKGTSVLEIPFSFKLHAFDKEYCPSGALTLLQVAALLEALTLPFGPVNVPQTASTPGEIQQPAPGAEGDVNHAAVNGSAITYNVAQDIYPPATCLLELIKTEIGGPGIVCRGYVKDAKVRLLGPFMRGPGQSQNLPSAGEFEFTFVHHPGHGNAIRTTQSSPLREQQAYAQIVKTNLYNTLGLLTNTDYHGFGDSTASAPAAPQPKVINANTIPGVLPLNSEAGPNPYPYVPPTRID